MKNDNDPCPCGSGRKHKNCHRRIQHRARKEEEARKSEMYEDLFNDEKRLRLCLMVNDHLWREFGFHPTDLRPTNPNKNARHRAAEERMKDWACRNGCRFVSWPGGDAAIDFLIRHPLAMLTPWAPDTAMILPDDLAQKILVLGACPC